MGTEVETSDSTLNSAEIDRIVSEAILSLNYFSDVVIRCPCGSGEILTDRDCCACCDDPRNTEGGF